MIKTVLFCPQDLEYSLLQWNCHFKHRETEDQGRGNMLGHSQIRFPYSFQPEHRSRTHGEIKISASCYSSIVLYGEISLTFVFLEGQIIQQNAAAETALWRKCCVTSIVFSLHLLGTWQEREQAWDEKMKLGAISTQIQNTGVLRAAIRKEGSVHQYVKVAALPWRWW